jgi:hypothetical protein
MFGRKPVVDDSRFVSYGVRNAAQHGKDVIENESSKIAPAPPIESVMENGGACQDGPALAIRQVTDAELELREQIKRLQDENARIAKKLKVVKKKRVADKKRGAGVRATGDYEPSDVATVIGRSSGTCQKRRGTGAARFTVVISVTHLNDDKHLKYLHDIGSITLEELQETARNRAGLPPLKNTVGSGLQPIMEDLMRNLDADAPQDDMMNGNKLDAGTGTKKIPMGLLLELVKNGGDLAKMDADIRDARHDRERRARKKDGAGGAQTGADKKRKRPARAAGKDTSGTDTDDATSEEEDDARPRASKARRKKRRKAGDGGATGKGGRK